MTDTSADVRTALIPLRGPYDLGEVALMGFGHRDESSFDGVMRLAFCLDGMAGQVGVEVRQQDAALELVVHGEGDLAVVTRQVARVVSADADGDAWAAVCAADPVPSPGVVVPECGRAAVACEPSPRVVSPPVVREPSRGADCAPGGMDECDVWSRTKRGRGFASGSD